MTAEINELRYNPEEHMIKEHGYEFANNYVNNGYILNGKNIQSNVEYCEPQELKTIVLYDKALEMETIVGYDEPLHTETNVAYCEPQEMETNVAYCEPLETKTIVPCNEPLEMNRMSTNQRFVDSTEPYQYPSHFEQSEEQQLNYPSNENFVFDDINDKNSFNVSNEIYEISNETKSIPMQTNLNQMNDLSYNLPHQHGEELSEGCLEQNIVSEYKNNHKNIYCEIAPKKVFIERTIVVETDLNQMTHVQKLSKQSCGEEKIQNNNEINYEIRNEIELNVCEADLNYEDLLKEEFQNKVDMSGRKYGSRVNFHHTTLDEERKGKVYYKTPKHSYVQSKLSVGEYKDYNEINNRIVSNSRSNSYVQNKQYNHENSSRSSRKSAPSRLALNDDVFYSTNYRAEMSQYDINQENGQNIMNSLQIENQAFVDESDQLTWPLNSLVDQETPLFDPTTTNIESSKKENLVYESSKDFENQFQNIEQTLEPPIHSILHHIGEHHLVHHEHIVWGENSTSDEVQSIVHQPNPKFRPSYVNEHEQHPHDEHKVYRKNSTCDVLQKDNNHPNINFKLSFVSDPYKSLQSLVPQNVIAANNESLEKAKSPVGSPSSIQSLRSVLVPSDNTCESKKNEEKIVVYSNNEEQIKDQRSLRYRSKSTSDGLNKHLLKSVNMEKSKSIKPIKSPSFVQNFISIFQGSSKNEHPNNVSEDEVMEPKNIEEPIKEENIKEELSSTNVHGEGSESPKEGDSPSFAQSLISLFQEIPNDASLKSLKQNEKVNEETTSTNNLRLDVNNKKTKSLRLNKSLSHVLTKKSKFLKSTKSLSYSQTNEVKSPKLSKSLSFTEKFMALFQSSPNDTSTNRLSQINNQTQSNESEGFNAIPSQQGQESDYNSNVSTLCAPHHELPSLQLSKVSNDSKNELSLKSIIQDQFEEYPSKNEFIKNCDVIDESRRASLEEVRKELSFKLGNRQNQDEEEESNGIFMENKHDSKTPYVMHSNIRNHEPRRYSIDKLGDNFKQMQERSQSTSNNSRTSLYSNLQKTKPKSMATSRFLTPAIEKYILEEDFSGREINNPNERNNNYDNDLKQSMHDRLQELDLENCHQHSIINSRQTSFDKNKNKNNETNMMSSKIGESIDSNCQMLTPSNTASLRGGNLTLSPKEDLACEENNDNILCIAKIRFVLPENLELLANHIQNQATTNIDDNNSNFRIGVRF